MDVILSSAQWQFMLLQLKDKVMLLENLKADFEQMHKIWKLQDNTYITLKLKKCQVFHNLTSYLKDIFPCAYYGITSYFWRQFVFKAQLK